MFQFGHCPKIVDVVLKGDSKIVHRYVKLILIIIKAMCYLHCTTRNNVNCYNVVTKCFRRGDKVSWVM